MMRTDTLEPPKVTSYLRRLGVDDVPDPNPETLRRLHLAHLERVPFENLDIHAGRRIELDVRSFVSKIVDEKRGGFCYELNGAFAALLGSLGFDVELLEAHVHDADGRVQPFDHLCLRVRSPEEFLVDVGFGDSFTLPVPFVVGVDHDDPAGTFRLHMSDTDVVELVRDGAPQYRAVLTPRRLADFAPGCEFHQSPESHFSKNTVCSRRTPNGRVTLRGLTLIRTVDGRRSEARIAEDQLATTLQREFGIRVSDELLERLTEAVTT